MSIKLVDDWRQAWRWISINSMTLAGSMQLTWINIPDDLRQGFDPILINYLTVGLLVLGIVGRLVKQGEK